MKNDWLWDRKMTEAKAKGILRDPSNKGFAGMAALLLSRTNDTQKVLKEYIDPLVFCRHWPAIKRSMRQDKWSEPRIVFWQAIYEKLADRYRNKGVAFREEAPRAKDPLCRQVGEMISATRREQGLSQKELAKKIRVSQQVISRIEQGGENVSLGTLTIIARALRKNVVIDFAA